MPMRNTTDLAGNTWTFGCEHELADWDCSQPMPAGCYRTPDYTVVNTNGIAAQPNTKVYGFGGEINTPPTGTPSGQCEILAKVVEFYKDRGGVAVNHRSNLHVHVRVPGLKDSLTHLKRVQQYVHEELPKVIDLVEPLPPVEGSGPQRKRAKRNRVSHRTLLTPTRLTEQLRATTVQRFFEGEVPRSYDDKPLWHAQARCCVNLRQLLQTDTVEFRHFPGTLDPVQLLTCVDWCREFLLAALNGVPISELWGRFGPTISLLGTGRSGGHAPFPKFAPFNEEREVRYWATAKTGHHRPEQTLINIRSIQDGAFDADSTPEAYAYALELAGGPKRPRPS